MFRRTSKVVTAVSLIIAFLTIAIAPSVALAQEIPWPPLSVEMSASAEAEVITFSIKMENKADWDMLDVVVKAPLPEGTTLVETTAPAAVTTAFDGKDVTFTLLRLGAKSWISDLNYKVNAAGLDVEALTAHVWASWGGKMPGTFLTPEIGIAGVVEEIPVAAREYVLGLSLSTLDNPFFVTLKEGAESVAEATGVKLVVVDCRDDSALEATNIEDLIQRKVDALLVNPTDADAIVPSIEKANAAGIPVFTVDRGAAGGEVVSHIASDNVAGGRLAGEELAKLLGGEGKVVELEGIAGTSSARDRGEGFNEVMANYPGIEIVARQTANYDRAEGLTVFENILQAQPEIDGVFSHNDEMVLGAIEAAEAAARLEEIMFVGFDAIDDAVAAVEEGKLAATIAQQPAVMGELSVATSVMYLNGEEVEVYIPVSLALVTPETLPE